MAEPEVGRAREDVVDLLLNLKGIVFKLHNRDEVFLTLRRMLPQGHKMPMRWRPSREQMDAAKALGWVHGATTEMKAPDFNGDHADALKLPSSGSWVLLFRFKDDELADVMGG